MSDERDLDGFEGMISAEEAALLYHYASMLGAGCIVEVGSWRGKSAIALARGAAANPGARSMVYCVDPHACFTGVYGGEFGPQDRKAFYETMLRAGCAEAVALINLPSAAAARAFPHKIGLLFIDGDHTEAAVEADVAAWERYLIDGGFIAFDDALDPEVGPSKVIAHLLASGRYANAASAGKIVILQKTPDAGRRQKWTAHAEALSDVRARAEAAGYDGDFAASRIGYGTFVSAERRYMYMETPKAACTSWKRLIAELEGARVDVSGIPYHRETRPEMLIHQRKNVAIPSLLEASGEDRGAILDGAADWHIFALCRNPYSRLVSVFENKVRLGEPGYRHLTARFGDGAGHSDSRAAFAAFVRELAADPVQRDGDAHLRPQSDLLLVKLIPYRRIYPIEQMRAALDALNAHLQARGHVAALSLETANESVARPWRSYYDASTAAIVREAYGADFAAFGYDAGDWAGDGAKFAETEYELGLRAEVVARNEMIERLYDLLDAQGRALKD